MPTAAPAALAEVLASPTDSLEVHRETVVRFARAARTLAVAPEAMLAALVARVRARTDELRPPRRAEVIACVQWWAIHGYYGAE